MDSMCTATSLLLEEEWIDNHNDKKDDDSNFAANADNNTNANADKKQMDTYTEEDIVMVDAAVQQKLKLSLSDAEDRINDLREYAKDSGTLPCPEWLTKLS